MEISFPGLGIAFNINKVAFSIGNIDVYWYALIMAVAFIIGILICKKYDGRFGIKFNNILDLCLFLIPISIICARIYYVVFNLSYYSADWSRIFDTRSRRNGNIWRNNRAERLLPLFSLKKEKLIFWT